MAATWWLPSSDLSKEDETSRFERDADRDCNLTSRYRTGFRVDFTCGNTSRGCFVTGGTNASSRFQHKFWTLYEAAGWIIDRKPGKFSRIKPDARALRAARRYAPAEVESRLRQLNSLYVAIRGGEIRAYREGKPVPLAFWRTHHLRDHSECAVLRTDILKAWPALKSGLKDAVRKRIDQGQRPGLNVMWQSFCADVRAECGIDKRVERLPRGFSDKSISRAVKTALKQCEPAPSGASRRSRTTIRTS